MKRLWIGALLLGLAFPVGAQEKMTEEEALQAIQECEAQKSQLDAKIAELESQVQALKDQKAEVENQIQALKNEIAELKAEIAKYPSEYTVQKGDYLVKIAGMRYIYNNPKAWPRIYRANRDKIKNPNLIYPGWVLRIPHGLVTSIEVIPGDNLWKIAGFSWIYNDPFKWPVIYKANTDKIKDPDLIYPGWILRIPRD